MEASITIIYPFRDRDVKRIASSLQSLENQTVKGFKVSFIDYGSKDSFSKPVKELIDKFDFAAYTYVAHSGLLWNKSKALNFGIRNAQSDYIITADVDILFRGDFIETVLKYAQRESFLLFRIGYLPKAVTEKQQSQLDIKAIETTFEGETFGIGLFPKTALQKIGGLDEFFHFYGSEDEDLNLRLTLSGVEQNSIEGVLLYHQWHPRYPKRKDKILTTVPRLTNILRLNQRHYLLHKEQKTAVVNDKNWGACFTKDDASILSHPHINIELMNIKSHVDHLFGHELAMHKDKILKVVITEDSYYKSFKYQLKMLLGKQTQPYLSMKAVNDLVLREILFHYRNYNYAYHVSEDLKRIQFTIDLNSLSK